MVAWIRLLDLALVWWCFIELTGFVGAYEALIAARCQARCLSEFETTATTREELFTPKNGSSHADPCERDGNCSSCVRPCDENFINFAFCRHYCKEVPSIPHCLNSCSFLKTIYTYKPGWCPHIDNITGFATACVESCQKDGECEDNLKCCPNNCGLTCQEPIEVHDGLPNVPYNIKAREYEGGNIIEIFWKLDSNIDYGPLVYVLENRWNIGKHHSRHHMIEWELLAKTTDPWIRVEKIINAGKWYEFRVASVSMNGTKGFSPESKPFKLSREPLPPGPPVNLTEGDFTIEDGLVDQVISWKPPESDLPIFRYRIYWSKRLKAVTPMLVSLEEHGKAVPGNKLLYTIEKLQPDTVYFVQVQAFSQYGNERLRGDRASTYVTTFPAPQGDMPTTSDPVPETLQYPGSLYNVSVRPPYYQNGLLKANIVWEYPDGFPDQVNKFIIHWKPEECIGYEANQKTLIKSLEATSHDLDFDMYDLRFDCRYEASVKPVHNDGRIGSKFVIHFQTPPCLKVIIKGSIKPDCPIPPPSVPDEPQNLTCIFMIRGTNISANCSWCRPKKSDKPISEFRIIYGRKLSDPDGLFGIKPFPIFDRNTAVVKVLPLEQSYFVIFNMKQNTEYLIQVQALSEAGDGRMTSLEILTPRLMRDGRRGFSEGMRLDKDMVSAISGPRTNTRNSALSFRILFITKLYVLLEILIVLVSYKCFG